ncbi:electron transport complex protein RnfC [Tindallia magadiensis]|uniref:Ion-translocating oxidoreductase complex subunit C n=1 Tax=Tindallia magadiensis TaxID=69895 RepID=A0A1I3A8X7_9FIRM|nr:electron transport complex subunit RsxC [Tindallia magadiensis]SFH45781.1 electron transport complex protein RnfC [Tindallia magadiensis]
MNFLTFKGGIHPPDSKSATSSKSIQEMKEPEEVIIPLQQHIGAPCKSLVKPKEEVKVGQLIGEPQGFVSSPVHATVSGTVKQVISKPIGGGRTAECVVIESDGKNELHSEIAPYGPLDEMNEKQIVEMIQKSGMVGMGGATFPTHVKLSPPPEKKIDTIIINGAECEPYLTADHRLMLEQPEMVIQGLKIIMKAVQAKKGIIAIEANKQDAIDMILKNISSEDPIQVVALQTKYPQGAEKQLIEACVKKQVPSGGLPMDVGVVVNNVGSAYQIAHTHKTGIPLIQRITTVTGSCITEPKNLRVRIGTPIKDLIEFCGGYSENPGKIIFGGPMMGIAQDSDEYPVIKGTSGVLAFNQNEALIPEPVNCIRCSKCIISCPISLMPVTISEYSLSDRMDDAKRYHALDCIECGSCSYVCPSKRPLLHSIRVAKSSIMETMKKQQK